MDQSKMRINRTKPLLKVLLLLAPLAFLGWAILVKHDDPAFYKILTRENRHFEWIQFWSYLAAGVLAAVATWHLRYQYPRSQRWATGLLAGGLFFVAAEEISWGQWVLGLDLPEYFKQHNTQKHLTLHNLDTFQPYLHLAYILCGTGLGFLWLVRPTLLKSRTLHSWANLLPPWWLMTYFLPAAVFYMFIDYMAKPLTAKGYQWAAVSFDHQVTFLQFKDQETVELLMAVGFVIWCTMLVRECGSLRSRR